MNDKEFKEKLINLLEDKEVREKIESNFIERIKHLLKKIFGLADENFDENTLLKKLKDIEDKKEKLSAENLRLSEQEREYKSQLDKVRDQNSDLKSKLDQNIKKNDKLEIDLQESNKEKEILKNKLEQSNTKNKNLEEKSRESQKELDKFKSDFSAYDKFLSLSEQKREKLKNILRGDSIATFIAVGVQPKNIENLWDYLSSSLREGQDDETKKLIEIFYSLFEYYKEASGRIYELDSVEVGDEFDATKYMRHNSSIDHSGKITSIILRGIVNINTKDTKRQSIVKLG